MSKHKYRTDFLFPITSFWIGMGSILNIGGNNCNFNYTNTPEEADYRAIESDWGVIGQDIDDTINSNPIKTYRRRLASHV